MNPVLPGNDVASHVINPLQAARDQVAAARLRREALIAAGRLCDPQASPAALPTIPGYTVLRLLHRGGQGMVYLARQESTSRQVAVKLLLHGALAAPSELARFQREVEVLGRLKHPNVVTIHDCGRADSGVFLVMDYVDGLRLDEYVRRNAEKSKSRKVEIERTLDLFAKVCDGVNAAHLRGIIHRDLKPSNILVVDGAPEPKFSRDSKRSASAAPESRSPDEVRLDVAEPRILDFGLAKLTSENSESSSAASMTLTGQFLGSLPWASPEQAEGRSDQLDVRTDVYSLGVILYQLLTGDFPYPVAGRMDEVVRHIAQSAPARPSSVDRSISSDLQTILLKCLAKEPERRYQSAGELGRDIRHYLQGEPIGAKRDSMGYVLAKQLRRHWVAVTVVAAFGLLLVAGLIVSTILWYRAESALVEKEAQRKLADQRAEETRRTAEFHARMLREIEPKPTGIGLRNRLIDMRRAAMTAAGMDEETLEAGIEALETALAGVNFTNFAIDTLDETIFERAINGANDQFADQPGIRAQLLQTIADTMRTLGLLDRAMLPQEEALRIRREFLGDEHPDTLSSTHAMGVLLQARGKPAEAEPLLRAALDKRRSLLGENHPDTLTSVHDLGFLFKEQGKLDEARSLYEDALEGRRRVLGDDHENTLTSINDLGILLKDQGRLAEAEVYYREALERKRRVLGNEHRNTLTSINNMGYLLQTQGKLNEAEPFYQEALEKRERTLGAEHPETLISISNMGFLRQAQGRLDEAEPFVRRSEELHRRVLGEHHPDTLVAITNLAGIFHGRGLLAQAEPYMREVFEKRRVLLGADHPRTLFSMGNLAVVLQDQGKLEEAESLKRDALDRRRRVLGQDHAETLNAIQEMGSVLQDQGRLAEAEIYYREAVDKSRRILGDAHPSTLVAINRLAGLRLAMGRPADAEPLAREALAGRIAKLPAAHRNIAVSRIGLGAVLVKLGANESFDLEDRLADLAEADALLRQAWEAVGEDRGLPAKNRTQLFESMIELHERWDALAPNQGHDTQAAEWRAKLDAWRTSTQPAEHDPLP